MRTAHLIIVHKNPEQIERLVKRLQHPDFDFYIHVDKKVNIKQFLNIGLLKNVYFISNRVDVRWACYNTSKAILYSIVEICNSGKKYNFINHMSGQDYPLKPVEYIADFFKNNSGKEYITYRDIIHDWKEAQMRYNRFHFINYRINGNLIVGRDTFEKLASLIFGKRKLPYSLHPYGESSFWMLSPETALFVANRVLNDKKLTRFFSTTWCADEFVFQTIIMNSAIKSRVVNENFRYINWSEKKANPKILTLDDINELQKSSMLFARKFDITQDAKILDIIDEIL